MNQKSMTIRIGKRDVRNLGLSLLMLAYLPSFTSRIIDIPFWGYICYLIILGSDVFFINKQKKLTKPVIWTSVFYGYLLIVTIISNPSQTYNCFIRTFLATSMAIYIEYIFHRRGRSNNDAIRVLLCSMELFNYINLISMILFPNGMFRVISNGIIEEVVRVEAGSQRTAARVIWLAGHQTMMIRFTLPGIIIALLNGVKDNKFVPNVRSISLILVCTIETIIANSAGNYLILLLFLLIMFLFRFHAKLNMRIVIPFIILIYAFFLTTAGDLSVFNWLSNSMQRSVQISTRVPAWLNTLNAWLQRPLFGYGFIEDGSMEIRRVLGLGNPHSSYLWTLYEGGIIGLLLLIVYIMFWTKHRGYYWKSISSKIVYAGFLCMLVCMIDDDHMFRSVFFLIIFELMYNNNNTELIKNEK